MKIKYYILFSFLLGGYTAKAQDANYWSASYNAAGILVPGSAIAFTKDSGLVYYNPALLAYNTRNVASISGSFYQYNALNIKNGVGDGFNLKCTNLSIVPVIASGILAIKGKRTISIGYAIINDPIINYKTNQQRDGSFDVLNNSYSPGAETFIGQYSAQNIINETSGLISTGIKLTPFLAAGVSASAQYRTQHFVESYSGRALINTTGAGFLAPISSAEELYDVSHYNVNLKFKLGLAYDRSANHVGLNFTLPSVKLLSNGQLLSDNYLSNLRLTPTDTINLLATTRQTKLLENFKTPLSIALGYAYDLSWGQVYIVGEHFASIGDYNIITPQNNEFIRGTGSASNAFTSSLVKFKDAHKSITNFGIGITYYLRPELTGYLSARTDYSYANDALYQDSDGHAANTSYYDIYHLQLGLSTKKRKFNLRTGLLIDYGHTNSFRQPVNVANVNESNYLTGDLGPTAATYFSIGIMFAYIHNF